MDVLNTREIILSNLGMALGQHCASSSPSVTTHKQRRALGHVHRPGSAPYKFTVGFHCLWIFQYPSLFSTYRFHSKTMAVSEGKLSATSTGILGCQTRSNFCKRSLQKAKRYGTSLGWVRTTNLSINSRTRCQLRHERCDGRLPGKKVLYT